jgi:hypothetical protein
MSSDYDFCGGELYFTVEVAVVLDEAGKSLEMKELDDLCASYWKEWKHKK